MSEMPLLTEANGHFLFLKPATSKGFREKTSCKNSDTATTSLPGLWISGTTAGRGLAGIGPAALVWGLRGFDVEAVATWAWPAAPSRGGNPCHP